MSNSSVTEPSVNVGSVSNARTTIRCESKKNSSFATGFQTGIAPITGYLPLPVINVWKGPDVDLGVSQFIGLVGDPPPIG